MKYVSLDIETTGLDRENHQVLEVGAIIEDTEKKLSYEDSLKFHAIIKHDNIVGNPYALNMNQRILEILAKIPRNEGDAQVYRKENNIKTPFYFVRDFQKWLKINYEGFPEESLYWDAPVKNVLVAGKNFQGFDKSFLYNISQFKERIEFHHRTLDPAMLFMDFEKDSVPPSLSVCKERAGLDDVVVTHEALQDAWDVIQVLRTKY